MVIYYHEGRWANHHFNHPYHLCISQGYKQNEFKLDNASAKFLYEFQLADTNMDRKQTSKLKIKYFFNGYVYRPDYLQIRFKYDYKIENCPKIGYMKFKKGIQQYY